MMDYTTSSAFSAAPVDRLNELAEELDSTRLRTTRRSTMIRLTV